MRWTRRRRSGRSRLRHARSGSELFLHGPQTNACFHRVRTGGTRVMARRRAGGALRHDALRLRFTHEDEKQRAAPERATARHDERQESAGGGAGPRARESAALAACSGRVNLNVFSDLPLSFELTSPEPQSHSGLRKEQLQMNSSEICLIITSGRPTAPRATRSLARSP